MFIVLVISISELIKLSLGTNGAILTNSSLYKVLFYFSLAMALSVFLLNRLLIEQLGIDGAALATLIVVLVFSAIKVYYVYRKLGMQPYTGKTGVLMVLIAVVFGIFYLLEFDLHPLIAILIKGTLITAVFLFSVLRMRISDDMTEFLRGLRRKS